MTRSTSTEVDQAPGLDDTDRAVVPDAVVAVHNPELLGQTSHMRLDRHSSTATAAVNAPNGS